MQPDLPLGDPRSDAELISSARLGDPSAFGVLYARHAPAVTSMARYYARDDFTADDLVSEAFERTMTVLRGGGGPDVSFRAYIYTVVRRLAYEQTEKAAKTRVTDDFSAFEMPDEIIDPAVSSFEGRVVTGAFATLPERWQAVLWYIEVEGMSPLQVAPMLGLTANGVSALAYRAREGLRQAYLQLHVTSTEAKPDCEPHRGKLGTYARNDVSARDKTRIENHLSTCDDCTAIVAELQDVGHGMRVIIAPLVLGGVAATGLGFASAPSSASAAAIATPRGLGRWGKSVAAVAAVAALAILTTAVAVALSGGSPPAGDVAAAPVSAPSPASVPEHTVKPTSAPTASPTPPAPSPTSSPRTSPPPVKPPVTPPTPTVTPPPTVVEPPTITVTMDEVGNLVSGRDGMVGATLTNSGAVPATTPSLTVTLPAGVVLDAARSITYIGGGTWACEPVPTGVSCTAPLLPAGQSAAVLLPVTVSQDADTTTVPSVTAAAARATPITASALSPVTTVGLGTRFLIDGAYGVTQSGASFLTCDIVVAGCPGAQQRISVNPDAPGEAWSLNNDSYPMVPVDEAGIGAPSSIATVDVPTGSTIAFAGLYWSGLTSTGDAAIEGSLQLRDPAGTTNSITATRVDHAPMSFGTTYQSYADVTSVVQSGGGGAWTASGADVNPIAASYAGWALVVVYSDPTLTPGRVTVFDGFQKVGDSSVTFGIAGNANTTAEIGMVSWEGDAGISGDFVTLDDAVLTRTHAWADPANSIDSTAHGTSVVNTFGVDVGAFLPATLTNQKGLITAGTAGDNYIVGVVTVSSR